MLNSRWIFIIIGDDLTGKTTFQKRVIRHLCKVNKDPQLKTNIVLPVKHVDANRKFERVFFMNRSFQEKKDEYKTIKDYFNDYIDKQEKHIDIYFLSSHLVYDDIKSMIEEGHKRIFNVAGVFWSNSYDSTINSKKINQNISLLNWDERFWLPNHLIKIEDYEITMEELFDDLDLESYIEASVKTNLIEQKPDLMKDTQFNEYVEKGLDGLLSIAKKTAIKSFSNEQVKIRAKLQVDELAKNFVNLIIKKTNIL